MPVSTGLSPSPPPAFLRVQPKVPPSRPSPAGDYDSPGSKTLGGIPFAAGEGAGNEVKNMTDYQKKELAEKYIAQSRRDEFHTCDAADCGRRCSHDWEFHGAADECERNAREFKR